MRMKPDWDRIADEAPADVLIADVDCGAETDVSTGTRMHTYMHIIHS